MSTSPWPTSLDTARAETYLTPAEQGLILEYNKVRSDPKRYAAEVLEPMRAWHQDKLMRVPGLGNFVSREGIKALDEAILDLQTKRTATLPILHPLQGLHLACLDHARDQGKTGAMGHRGADGSNHMQRALRHCTTAPSYSLAENIGYGSVYDHPALAVALLLIDDGVRDRGHRHNIFLPQADQIGVCIRPHPKQGPMTVHILGFGFR